MAILKYKDPITGNWIELSNAVGDTLPIGTIVDYDGTEVPPNWEKVGESGGGTKDGNEVEVTDTEPTDATVDLWVDTSEEDEFFQVVDDLTSDSSTNALSAKQGKVLNEKITNLTTYSKEEVKTGEIWIDGKPIYRKVFVGNWISTTLAWTNLVKGNISNCNTVVSIKGIIKNPNNGDNIPIPSYETDNFFANIMYNQSDDYIKCFLKGWTYNAFKMTYIIVLEYTKTTD